MTVPFRLQVMQALTATLAAISPGDDNEFEFDLTDAVFRGRIDFSEGDPLPMMSILEDPRALEQDEAPAGHDAIKGPWNLLLQGFVKDDPVHPTDKAYYLLRDAKKALVAARTKDTILGFACNQSPCITSMTIGAGVVRPPDNISSKAYFWLPVTLNLIDRL